jgi:hypothetical protein
MTSLGGEQSGRNRPPIPSSEAWREAARRADHCAAVSRFHRVPLDSTYTDRPPVELLAIAALQYPDRNAHVAAGRTLTYRQYRRCVALLAP